MKNGAAFFIALRYLWGRAKEGGRYLRGAAAGIALSLIPIVVTLIVADGMIRGITDRFLELGTGHIKIYNYFVPSDPEEALPVLLSGNVPVRGAWEEAQSLGVLLGPKGSKGATIRAIDKDFWNDAGTKKYLKVLSGSAQFNGRREVFLGSELAASIGAEAGSSVRIMTMRTGASGKTLPRITTFTVRGIISSGYQDLDAMWCIMNLDDGVEVLSPDSTSYSLLVKVNDPYNNIDQTSFRLFQELGPGYGVYTWRELQRAQYSSYESTRQMLLFIMALIVLVAAVNVSSATSMLVIERQRDIAVFKSGGGSPRFTSRVFLWGAFLTGLAGSLVGLAAGLAVGVSVNAIVRVLETVLGFFSAVFHRESVVMEAQSYYLETIPVIIDWKMIFLIGLFTILTSLAASYIPARRAGKLKPVEILRKY